MQYWLFKTEPSAFSWERLKAEGRTEWSGVRNFQARNNMLAMKLGDLGFFYHSSIAEPAVVGICKVVREAYPDFTAFDPQSPYYDPKYTAERPAWKMVDVGYEADIPHEVTLAAIRANPQLSEMVLVSRSRLSVQPVTKREWDIVLKMSAAG